MAGSIQKCNGRERFSFSAPLFSSRQTSSQKYPCRSTNGTIMTNSFSKLPQTQSISILSFPKHSQFTWSCALCWLTDSIQLRV